MSDRLSPVRRLSRRLSDTYTDMEHGTKACLVPYSWREQAHRHALWRVYAVSSWAFAALGLFNLVALGTRSRALYRGEWCEGLLWIWQGVASYWCDVHDFARPSISHPVDRATAALIAVQQCVKYGWFASSWGGKHFRHCAGEPWSSLIFSALFGGALYSFHRSSRAVREGSLGDFLFWHSAWHFALPGSVAWWLVVYFYLSAASC